MTVDAMLITLMSMKKAGCGETPVKFLTKDSNLVDINVISLNTNKIVMM